MVSKQKGPIMPRAPSSSSKEEATVPSAIRKALGSRDSRMTTGWLPVTTKDGSSDISRRSRKEPSL